MNHAGPRQLAPANAPKGELVDGPYHNLSDCAARWARLSTDEQTAETQQRTGERKQVRGKVRVR
jgi:hypothetical protein